MREYNKKNIIEFWVLLIIVVSSVSYFLRGIL